MEDLTAQIAPQVATACQAGAGELAEALSRVLTSPVTVTTGESTPWNDALSATLTGPGLAVTLKIGASGAIFLLPESSGLLPAWYAEPDATGVSKLSTLAQELGMIALPEPFAAEDFAAARVPDMAAALVRAQVAAEAATLPLNLEPKAGDKATATLIWPVANVAAALTAGSPVASQAASAPAPPSSTPPKPAAPKPAVKPAAPPVVAAAPPVEAAKGFESLPSYSRSLLRIKVPVMVTLANKKQPIGKIVELVPGAIIQFNKSCEEMLELEVSGHRIARGECVKVGDKFGLRITSLILPDERFHQVRSAG